MHEQRTRWLPSPALLLSMVALVVAMAGTAVALPGSNTVKSNDIAKNAVKGKDIASDSIKTRHLRDGKITPPKLDLFKTGAVPDEVSTTSGPPADLGGPSVTVTVPTDGLVGIFARVEGRGSGGGANGQVHLFEPTLLSGAPVVMEFPNDPNFALRQTAPGSGDSDGVGSALRGGMIVIAPPPGTYTFSLRYSQSGGGTANFRNRAIWAGVLN